MKEHVNKRRVKLRENVEMARHRAHQNEWHVDYKFDDFFHCTNIHRHLMVFQTYNRTTTNACESLFLKHLLVPLCLESPSFALVTSLGGLICVMLR